MKVIEINAGYLGSTPVEMVVLVKSRQDGHKLTKEDYKSDAEKLKEFLGDLPHITVEELKKIL